MKMSQEAKSITRAQFRAARALLDWSRSKLGDKAGYSLPTVQRVEKGGAKVSDEVRQRLKETLEAAGVEFIDGDAPGVRLHPRRRGKTK
jgi:ribosome-binding protein aMBF1 (putative translation factor)